MKSILRFFIGGVAFLSGSFLPPLAYAQNESTLPSSFVRIVKDARGDPISLDTAIVRFGSRPTTDTKDVAAAPHTTVDLVAAVHVGEKSYYDDLNRRFRDYDVVLYELVAEKDAAIPHERAGTDLHPVSMMQIGLRNLLKLEFQLEAIDYRAANMEHADMSPNQLSRAMAARRESFGSLLMRAMAAAAARDAQTGGKPPDLSSMFLLMFDDARAMALRRIMAREFEDIDQLLNAINGEEGSSIVQGRNDVALRALRHALKRGESRIAIFYGGAHMPDFAEKLSQKFNLIPLNTEWLVAWKLKAANN